MSPEILHGIPDEQVPAMRKLLHDVNDELSIAVMQLEMMLEDGTVEAQSRECARGVARRMPQGGRQPEAGLDHPRSQTPHDGARHRRGRHRCGSADQPPCVGRYAGNAGPHDE